MGVKKSFIWKIPDERFREYVKDSTTWTELSRKCGYKNLYNIKTIRKRIEESQLDITHLPIGLNWAEGKVFNIKYKLEEILILNSHYTNMVTLRARLVKEKNWEQKCSNCELEQWIEKPIPLEIHHINGVHTDNRIENICFLCPNCHAFTDTYRGKNIYRSPKREQRCSDCNQKIYCKSIRCVTCSNKRNGENRRKIKNRPSLEQLETDLETLSYVKVGQKYGVSDNTIRKWIRFYKAKSTV